MTLNLKAFALTCSILWGAGMFVLTWWLIVLGDTAPFPIERIYIGYSISPVGSLIGLLWGLVDGVIAGAAFAWIYNQLAADSS